MFVAGHTAPPPMVQIRCTCPHPFRVARPGRIGRWFREVGYTVPILARDHAFDERWSVECHDREFGEALVRDPQARAAILALGELGCTAIGHHLHKLTAVLRRHPRRAMRSPEHKQAVREQLQALDGLMQDLTARRSFPHRGGYGRLITAAVILLLSFAAGLVGLAIGSRGLVEGEIGPLALRSLIVSAPLALLVIAAAALLLAGRSASHKELGVVAVLALVCLPVLGIGAALTINRELDDGAATVRHVPVTGLLMEQAKGGEQEHFALVPPWRSDRGPTQTVRVDAQTAATLVPGQSWLRLTTSPGKLNAERLLEWRVEDAPPGR